MSVWWRATEGGRIASLALTDLPGLYLLAAHSARLLDRDWCSDHPELAFAFGCGGVHGIAARGGPGITTTTRLTGSPLVPVLETGGGRRQKTGDTGDPRVPRNAHHTNASIRVSLVGLVALAGEPRARYPSQAAGSLGPFASHPSPHPHPLDESGRTRSLGHSGLVLGSLLLVPPSLYLVLPCLTYLSWCPRERGFHPSFLSFSISTSSFYSQINFSHLGLVLSPCP